MRALDPDSAAVKASRTPLSDARSGLNDRLGIGVAAYAYVAHPPRRLVLAVLVAVSVAIGGCRPEPLPRSESEPADGAQHPIDAAVAAKTLGSDSAAVTLVVVSDFTCPYCAELAQSALPALTRRYVERGLVRLVFLTRPSITQPNAWAASEAALCAGEQGAFWAMHDSLFAAQSRWRDAARPAPLFLSWAGQIGLDRQAFDACREDDRMARLILHEAQQAEGANIQVTPALVFNRDTYLLGLKPLERIEGVIDSLLATAGAQETREPSPLQGGAP